MGFSLGSQHARPPSLRLRSARSPRAPTAEDEWEETAGSQREEVPGSSFGPTDAPPAEAPPVRAPKLCRTVAGAQKLRAVQEKLL